jgi:hypothetical protein
MLCSVIVMELSTLLKMLMNDPPSPAGNPGKSVIKLFLARNTSGISGFTRIFLSGAGKLPSGRSIPGQEEFN